MVSHGSGPRQSSTLFAYAAGRSLQSGYILLVSHLLLIFRRIEALGLKFQAAPPMTFRSPKNPDPPASILISHCKSPPTRYHYLLAVMSRSHSSGRSLMSSPHPKSRRIFLLFGKFRDSDSRSVRLSVAPDLDVDIIVIHSLGRSRCPT